MAYYDKYITEYYKMNYEELSKIPNNSYSNLNFMKLPYDKNIVNITIDIFLSDQISLKENIEWNLEDQEKSPEKFGVLFVDMIKDEFENLEFKEKTRKNITKQIREQIVEHIVENTNFTRKRATKEEIFFSSLLCSNCGTVKQNNEYCPNCMYVFEKKLFVDEALNYQIVLPEFEKQERINDLNNYKNKDLFSSNNNLNNSNENTEEPNFYCLEKKKQYRTLEDYIFTNSESTFSINYWFKINKHIIVSHLKKFSAHFSPEDFSSLKYLNSKIIKIINENYKGLLTNEAYNEVINYVNKMYRLFSKPTLTIEKVFDAVYLKKYGKARTKLDENGKEIRPMLNFNDLDCKEGYLPDNYFKNLYDRLLKRTVVKKFNVTMNVKDSKVSKNTTKGDEKNEDKNENNEMLQKKRGRPRKYSIFREDDDNQPQEKGINLDDRNKLWEFEISPYPTMHYAFCGKCKLPPNEDRLLLCETCSSSYHHSCLNYEKSPKGKFSCYFCKIQKFGIENSAFIDLDQIKMIKKLQKPIKNMENKIIWNIKLNQLIEVLIYHPCSIFYRDKVPENLKDYLEEFGENISLLTIQKKVKDGLYDSPQDMIDELYRFFTNNMSYFNISSFMYFQIKSLYNLTNYLLLKEKIFGNLIQIKTGGSISVIQETDLLSSKEDEKIDKNESEKFNELTLDKKESNSDEKIELDTNENVTNSEIKKKRNNDFDLENIKNSIKNSIRNSRVSKEIREHIKEDKILNPEDRIRKKRGRKKGVKLGSRTLNNQNIDLGGINEEYDDRFIGKRTRSKYLNKYTAKDVQVDDDEKLYTCYDISFDEDSYN